MKRRKLLIKCPEGDNTRKDTGIIKMKEAMSNNVMLPDYWYPVLFHNKC